MPGYEFFRPHVSYTSPIRLYVNCTTTAREWIPAPLWLLTARQLHSMVLNGFCQTCTALQPHSLVLNDFYKRCTALYDLDKFSTCSAARQPHSTVLTDSISHVRTWTSTAHAHLPWMNSPLSCTAGRKSSGACFHAFVRLCTLTFAAHCTSITPQTNKSRRFLFFEPKFNSNVV